MVNDMDINELVKTCKILLLDIEGTTTSISFVKDKLFPYVEDNVQGYLESKWEEDYVKEAIAGLRKLELEDKENKLEGLVEIPGEDKSKGDQIEGLVKNVKWQMSSDRKTGALKTLQGLIWKQGYDNGDIKGHVYDDVLPALEQWQSVEGRKVYIYSSGSVQAQKLLFGQSVAGDLLKYIDGHFDTTVGQKREPISYTKIAEKIGCKPEEILFLTDIVEEAEAATIAGLNRALVIRGTDSKATLVVPALTSFAPLCPTLKRPHDQEGEEKPAKIPKTIEEENITPSVETASEPIKELETVPEAKEEEVMQVDEDSKPEEDDVKEVPTITVEEITDTSADIDLPVVTTEPIVTEHTEKMEEDEKIEENTKETTKGSDKEAEKEEITEIEEICDKESPVDEDIEDAVPVVEEPKSVEMVDLQNAGDVLDKECGEILSKVKTITDIPVADKITKNGDSQDKDTESKMNDDERMAEDISEPKEEVTKANDEAEKVKEVGKTDDKPVKINEEIVEEKDTVMETNVEETKTNKEIPKTEVEVEKPKEIVAKDNEETAKVELEKEEKAVNVSEESDIEKTKDISTGKSKEEKEPEKTKNTSEDKVDSVPVEDVKNKEKSDEIVEHNKQEKVDKIKGDAEEITEEDAKTDNKDKDEEHTKSADEPVEAIETVPTEEPKVNGKTNLDMNKSLNGKTNGNGEIESRIENGSNVGNDKEVENKVNNDNKASETVAVEEDSVLEIKVKSIPTEMVPEQATET